MLMKFSISPLVKQPDKHEGVCERGGGDVQIPPFLQPVAWANPGGQGDKGRPPLDFNIFVKRVEKGGKTLASRNTE